MPSPFCPEHLESYPVAGYLYEAGEVKIEQILTIALTLSLNPAKPELNNFSYSYSYSYSFLVLVIEFFRERERGTSTSTKLPHILDTVLSISPRKDYPFPLALPGRRRKRTDKVIMALSVLFFCLLLHMVGEKVRARVRAKTRLACSTTDR